MPASTTGGKSSRGRGVLGDGHQSRGYVALELEVLDGSLSLAAIGFLAAMRRRTFVDETDGHLLRRQVDSVAREHGIQEAELAEILADLERTGRVIVTRDTARDTGYLAWNTSRAARDHQRQSWRDRKKREREKESHA